MLYCVKVYLLTGHDPDSLFNGPFPNPNPNKLLKM